MVTLDEIRSNIEYRKLVDQYQKAVEAAEKCLINRVLTEYKVASELRRIAEQRLEEEYGEENFPLIIKATTNLAKEIHQLVKHELERNCSCKLEIKY